jgi:AcrR family transcriptional regulator
MSISLRLVAYRIVDNGTRSVAQTRKKTTKTRRRRTAEQARREILDAAARQLAKAGPDSIRLQDVARVVGVSHPTVLHHFGSRDELVRAVVRRAFETLQAELVGAFQMTEIGERETVLLLERAFKTLGSAGYARVLAWLLLSGSAPHTPPPDIAQIRVVAEAAHAHRKRRRGAHAGDFEDTLFTTLLAALALFGDAVAGDALRRSAGLGDDPDAARRFRSWLAKLMVEHADSTPAPRGAKKR